MRNKTIFFFLTGLVLISMVVNSCKKESQLTSIQSLFTAGKWQLASIVITRFIGANQSPPVPSDTLNTTCDSTQLFTFNTNNTCTYSNFACMPQVVTGSWSLTADAHYLLCEIACKDTLAGGVTIGTVKPFIYSQIVNLGQYSMILNTGDIATYYTATTRRRIVTYGFVRQKAPVGN